MLNERSLRNLEGVHPDLVRVVHRAAETESFIVTEGLRNLERQRILKTAGKSWTLNSRHLTGHAVDVVDPDGRYDIPDLDRIAIAMKAAAKELNVQIVWGGDWKSRDTPHFELDRKAYPADGISTGQKVAEKAVDAVTSKPGLIVAGGGAATTLPAPPDLTPYLGWQAFGETVVNLGSWAVSKPLMTGALVLFMGLLAFAPQLRRFLP
ncbi:MAG: M15 family metallopeptidase [Pseudomonadota bacterium]